MLGVLGKLPVSYCGALAPHPAFIRHSFQFWPYRHLKSIDFTVLTFSAKILLKFSFYIVSKSLVIVIGFYYIVRVIGLFVIACL